MEKVDELKNTQEMTFENINSILEYVGNLQKNN